MNENILCPYCSFFYVFVYIQSHYYGLNCIIVVDDCCNGQRLHYIIGLEIKNKKNTKEK